MIADDKPSAAAAAGDFGKATAGNFSVAAANYRGEAVVRDYSVAVTRHRGISLAGHDSTAISGRYGMAKAGDCGTAFVGDEGAASAGYGGQICIQWFDENASRRRTAVGYVGEDGIKPNTLYRLDEDHKFVEVISDANDEVQP